MISNGDACIHCPDGSCPGEGSTDIRAWEEWIRAKPREELPAWAQRRKDAQDFAFRPVYRLNDLPPDS